jgi:restriction endonuclease S subunit
MSYFNSDAGRSQLLGKATTSSGLHNINSRLIASLQLPIPEMAEQREIVGLYDSCDASIRASNRETEVLEELFAVVLGELMNSRRTALSRL